MTTYEILYEGGCTEQYEADTIEDAAAYARQSAQDGGWDTSDGTVFCSIWITEVLDAEDLELGLEAEELHLLAPIEPDEPECVSARGHRWVSPHELLGGCESNPGVWGQGGGVLIRCVCSRCGCYRVVDTWAEYEGVQGLTRTSYEPPDSDSRAWLKARKRKT
jgi:hypothetical protein